MVGESYQATFRWHPVCIVRGSFKQTAKVIDVDIGLEISHDEIGQMSVSVCGFAFVRVLLFVAVNKGPKKFSLCKALLQCGQQRLKLFHFQQFWTGVIPYETTWDWAREHTQYLYMLGCLAPTHNSTDYRVTLQLCHHVADETPQVDVWSFRLLLHWKRRTEKRTSKTYYDHIISVGLLWVQNRVPSHSDSPVNQRILAHQLVAHVTTFEIQRGKIPLCPR